MDDLHSFAQHHAHASPEATVIAAAGRPPLTYRELARREHDFQLLCRRAGIGPEDVLALVLTQGPDTAALIWSACMAATAAPLNPGYSAAEFNSLFELLSAKALLVAAGERSAALAVARRRGMQVIEVRTDTIGPIGHFEATTAPTSSTQSAPAGDATALLLFTSGTSARPRLVPLTHRQLAAAATNIASVLTLTPSDRCLGVMPLFHIHGLSLLFSSIAAGGAFIGMPGFTPEAFYEALSAQRPTWYSASPAIHRLVLDQLALHKGDPRQSSLRLIRSASAPMPPTWIGDLERTFGVPFIEAYGMTEAGPLVASNRLPPAVRKPGSVGPPAGCEVGILDSTGRPVPSGAIGEIAIRGPSVTGGYRNDAEANRAAFVNGWMRTGDLGRVDDDHYLFVTGRLKEVINRGGEKISPRLVDDVLSGHPDVVQIATFGVPHAVLGEDIAAAVVLSSPLTDAIAMQTQLREYASARLAAFEVPHRFVFVEKIPLSPAGKLIRSELAHKLGLLGAREPLPVNHARTPAQRRIAQVLAEVLRVNELGIDDDFFALGGHSLAAIQVSARLGQIFHLPLPVDLLFAHSTVAEIANHVGQRLADLVVEGAARVHAATDDQLDLKRVLSRHDPVRPAPLSFPQQRVYFLDRMGSGQAYHMTASLRFRGPLDTEALRQAMAEIVTRHAALRTTFPVSDGEPVQMIRDVVSFDVPIVDLSSHSAKSANEQLRDLARAAARPFDLTSGPLCRTTLVRTANDDHVLLLDLHHIICDGWSVGVLHDELRQLYSAFAAGQASPLKPLDHQYPDFAVWQRALATSGATAGHLSYWDDQLRGAPPVCTLPTDRPRPVLQTYAGATVRTHVDPALLERLTAVGHAENATPFMVLLAAFQTLLLRCNGQEDCVVGTPFAGRVRQEWEPLVGFFANTLVLRTSLAADPLFSDLLARVKVTAVGAFAHQDLPLERLIDHLRLPRDASRTPLFQVMFAFQNLPDGAGRALHFAPGLTAERFTPVSESAKFDLTLYLNPSERGLDLRWQYNTDLYDAATVERFARQFSHLLQGIADDPRRVLSSLPLMDDAERHRLEVDWNNTVVLRVQRQNVLRLIDEHVRQTPGATAVVDGQIVWTYADLDRRATTIGHFIADRGMKPGQLIGICLSRSADHIAAFLGAWKAGTAFLPIDPNYPVSRIAFLCADAGAAALLTDADHCRSLASETVFKANIRLLSLDTVGRSDGPLDLPSGDTADNDTLAYVIYTSGSTGRPKGVMISHGNVCHYAQAMAETLGIGADDRYLHTAPFGFSSSVRQFVVPLACGAAVVVADADTVRDPARLFDLAQRQQVSVIDLVPSMWSGSAQVLRSLPPAERIRLLEGSLRLALSASEPLPASIARTWRSWLPPRVRQINMFGQTETTGIVSTYPLPTDPDGPSGVVPIGRPIANTRLYVLDSKRQIVPVGIPGELFVAGDGVGLGYRNQPELTECAFEIDPFGADGPGRLYRTGDLARYRSDGVIEFLGRIDGQVKVRGYRIELAEIEAAIRSQASVTECAVVPVATDVAGIAANTRLAAFVAPATIDTVRLRNDLKTRLPDYMVPATVHALDRLPRTISGKVDRTALLADASHTSSASVSGDATPSGAERILTDVWKQVLGLNRVGPHENFFDLGGNSLLSIPVISRANEAGLRITLAQLYQNQTICELALAATGLPAEARSERAGDRRVETPTMSTGARSALPDELPVLVTVGSLRAYGREALRRAGLCEEGAAVVTEVQLEASLRGQPTHNMVSIPRYAKRLSTGKLNAKPDIRVEHETVTSARVDGDNGPGQWVATVAMDLAIRKAQQHGVGMVSVRRSNHFGAAAQYVWPATQAGLIGLCTTNGPLILAPTGGVRATFGNNPVGVGIPAGTRFPILLDIAMSVAPRGRIGLAVAEGRPLSAGWILDARGRPTTDLADLAAGLGVPIGGHKGYGLALVMEVLAGALGGAGFCADHHRDRLASIAVPPDYGHFFMAIDPGLFGPQDAFVARVDRMIEQTKASPLAEGATEILVPGEFELRARQRSLSEGVSLRPSTYAALLSYASDANLETTLDLITPPEPRRHVE